ncbi:MAG: ribosome-associated translation inhibitor RaiA [Bacilli bacterium]
MEFTIRGKNLEVTDSIKTYIKEKIGKLDKYFENPKKLTATVLISVKNNEQTVEVTIPAKKIILRAEEGNKDLYASIDLVSEKMERQIRKNKTKMNNKKNKKIIQELNFTQEKENEENNESFIVKRKKIEMKPMNEEEAILQMELIGHEFFIFKNEETGNDSVVYRRKDGNYGLIDTK